MPTAKLTFQTTISGLASGSGSVTVTADADVSARPQSVAAAKAGVLTTRTNGTSGSLTMSGGHGIITGQRVDLYWSGGQCYGATVGTVSGNTVPIASVSGGDALPIATTAITVGKPEDVPFAATGDDLAAMALIPNDSARSYFVFADGGGDILAFYIASGGNYPWDGTTTNPLAGEAPTKVFISHDDTSEAKTNMIAVGILN